MKGLLVTILSPSCMGKDYCASSIAERVENYYQRPCVVFADAYKVRKRRTNDGNYIKCVDSEKDIPTAYNLRDDIFNGQVIAYNEQKINQLINDGKIVLVLTASANLCQEMKKKFDKQMFSIKIVGAYKSLKSFKAQLAKRYQLPEDNASIIEEAERRYNSTVSYVEKINNFEADEVIFNRYTFNKYLETGSNTTLQEIDDSIIWRIIDKTGGLKIKE